ncbi:MAG: putative rane protein [Actinomycetota bacterium]|nr:putative rane protein [Actinomycetota bacterium]
MVDPGPAVMVLAAGGCYWAGWSRTATAPDRPDGHARQWWRPCLFGAGLATVAVALVSPLDGMARSSLTAHMVQHVLLLVVGSALLVAAAPVPTLLAGLPRVVRDAAAPGWALVSASARSRLWPAWMAAAVVVQTAVMWAWHAPALYGAALDDKAVHAVEHLSFLGAGLLFWGALAAAVAGRRGAGVVAMFVAALPGTALGAALTLAPRTWYPAYPSLEDQQLAGVVMWGFAGALYVVAAGVVFGLWLAAEDAEVTVVGPTRTAVGAEP